MACGSLDVVHFLRLLLRRIRGTVLVIWDMPPIHRSQSIKNFLHNGAAKCLHLEQVPGYAPELNPDEQAYTVLACRRYSVSRRGLPGWLL
jgi:hypothetical protein